MPSRRTLRTATRACFGIFVGQLDQFLAPFLVQFRDRNAQQLAVHLRIEAEAGVADRLVHRLNHAPVPDLHRQQAAASGVEMVPTWLIGI